jgi:hypothetical protein
MHTNKDKSREHEPFIQFNINVHIFIQCTRNNSILYYLLAEISGDARDSIRNEGIRDLQRFLPPRKSPRHSLDRRLGGPQNRSVLCGEEKHLAPSGNPTPERTPKKTPPLHSNSHIYRRCRCPQNGPQRKRPRYIATAHRCNIHTNKHIQPARLFRFYIYRRQMCRVSSYKANYRYSAV